MNREFVINIILLIGINVLIKPFYLFGIDAKIQYLVGQESYGIFFTLFNFAYLFQIINDPGIQNYNSHKVASDESFIHKNLGKLLQSKAVFGLLFLIAVAFGGLVMGYPASYFYILLLVSINHFFATLFIFLRSNIAALGRYRTDSMISGLDKVLMVVILGYLLYVQNIGSAFQIEYLIYAQMVSYVVACTVAGVLLRSSVQQVYWDWSFAYMRQLLKDTLPYALVLLLMTIYSRMDTVMLERILMDNGFQSGVYASCYRFMEALNMVGYLFAALLLPMYARMFKSGEGIASLSNIALRLMLLTCFTAALCIGVFRMEILHLLYPYADQVYGDTLALLLVGYIAISISYIYGTMQVANGTLSALNWVFFAGVVLNILLNFALISDLKVVGAAIATAVTQTLVMMGQIYLGHSRFSIPYDFKLMLRLILWLGVSASGVLYLKSQVNLDSIIAIGLSILICALTALLLGVIKKDMLFSLLRNSKRT